MTGSRRRKNHPSTPPFPIGEEMLGGKETRSPFRGDPKDSPPASPAGRKLISAKAARITSSPASMTIVPDSASGILLAEPSRSAGWTTATRAGASLAARQRSPPARDLVRRGPSSDLRRFRSTLAPPASWPGDPGRPTADSPGSSRVAI